MKRVIWTAALGFFIGSDLVVGLIRLEEGRTGRAAWNFVCAALFLGFVAIEAVRARRSERGGAS